MYALYISFNLKINVDNFINSSHIQLSDIKMQMDAYCIKRKKGHVMGWLDTFFIIRKRKLYVIQYKDQYRQVYQSLTHSTLRCEKQMRDLWTFYEGFCKFIRCHFPPLIFWNEYTLVFKQDFLHLQKEMNSIHRWPSQKSSNSLSSTRKKILEIMSWIFTSKLH